MMRLTLIPLLLAVTLFVAGCSDPNQPPSDEEGTVELVLDLSLAAAAGYSITDVTVVFTHLETGVITLAEQAVTGDSAEVDANLRPGRWQVDVEIYEGETLVGQGQTVALVEPGFVTEVDLEIEIVTGGIRVTVSWPEDVPLVADLSDRPVTLQIEGVGSTYDAHGLSRIGWDIEVLETPTGGGLTHKRPGRVRRPDVVMLDLTATGEAEARALRTWIADIQDPRSINLLLQGPAGERAEVALYEAVPVSGDTTLTDLGDNVFQVSGLRVSWSSLALVGYTAPTGSILPPCPRPGYFLEIEGISFSNSLCYGENNLAVPMPGTSDPLPLPRLRDGNPLYRWAEVVRDDAEAFGCVGCNVATRRAVAVWHLDSNANITESTNLYGTWPASFTLFDPHGDYGYELLTSAFLVSDAVQDGS